MKDEQLGTIYFVLGEMLGVLFSTFPILQKTLEKQHSKIKPNGEKARTEVQLKETYSFYQTVLRNTRNKIVSRLNLCLTVCNRKIKSPNHLFMQL